MSGIYTDEKLALLGNGYNLQNGWNKKMCFEARDTLFECTAAQENGNKYRCPDELYAYEMYCPGDFRRMHSYFKRRNDIQEQLYTKEEVDNISKFKNTINYARWSHQA